MVKLRILKWFPHIEIVILIEKMQNLGIMTCVSSNVTNFSSVYEFSSHSINKRACEVFTRGTKGLVEIAVPRRKNYLQLQLGPPGFLGDLNQNNFVLWI